MKNKILFAITFIICMFCSITSANALTKINFAETSNGNIKTTIHFEDGFVGGLDLALKLTGEVSIKDFNFENKIKNSNYTKSYKYDSNNHILTIRVTSGGIGTKHNLLNSNKELALGNIVLSTASNKNVNYSLDKSSLKIVNNNWNSKTINNEHIILGDTSNFIYVVNNQESNPPQEEQKPSDSNQNENDNETNNNNQENNNQTNNDNEENNSNPNVTNNSNNNNNNSNVNNQQQPTNNNNSNSLSDNTNDNLENENIIDEETNDSLETQKSTAKEKTNSKKEIKEEKTEHNVLKPLIIGIIVIAAIAGIYFFITKKKSQ